MKKIILQGIAFCFLLNNANSQAPFKYNDPSLNGSGNNQYWSRGGNTGGISGNNNNAFGTLWPSPIYFVTGGGTPPTTNLRMKLNGPFTSSNQYSINNFNSPLVNTTGYLLLGNDGATASHLTTPTALYERQGAFSMLHLNGDKDDDQHVQEDGYRPWMKIGITFTSNNDLAYIGHRRVAKDATDMVIGWSNDVTNSGTTAKDNLVFTFLKGNTNDYGTEVARFTPDCPGCPVPKASFGIGNFNPGTPNGPGTSNYVGSTLDVDGDARIRNVKENSTLTQILVRDPNDHGRLYWRNASSLTGGGGGNFGNLCGDNPNPLNGDHEVRTDNYNFHFTDPDVLYEGHDQVTVGSTACNVQPAKFNVIADQKSNVAEHSIGLYVEENNQASNANNQARTSAGYLRVQQHNVTNDGVYGYAADAITNYGGRFESDQPYTNGQPAYNERNYGVAGFASQGAQTCGVEGIATDGGNTLTNNVMGGNFDALGGFQTCYGVRGTSATDGIASYGGYFESVGNDNISYGVYGAAWGSAANTYAGYFNGDAHVVGLFTSSDNKLKQNVQEIGPAMKIIDRLSPKKYEYQTETYPQLALPKGEHYGFIAQELEEVLPQAVKNTMHPARVNEKGETISEAVQFKAVNYQEIIPLLVKGMQEQSEKISQLEARLAACCTASKSQETGSGEFSAGSVIQTRLQNADEPTLGQNIPNPFETSTRIPVYLPQTVGKAELLFYGNDGRVLQTVQINERGNVQVDVNSEALASGIYSYTLFTDGKPVETRKMIKR